MKIILQVVLLITSSVQRSCGQLLPCNAILQKVCSTNQTYATTISPDPLPTKINLCLKIYEVIAIDDDQQTVSLSVKAMADWQDYRLDVNRSKDYVER